MRKSFTEELYERLKDPAYALAYLNGAAKWGSDELKEAYSHVCEAARRRKP
jgi:hypothetical protein